MKVHKPTDKSASIIEEDKDDAEKYYERLRGDAQFQKYVINDLFNMDDYLNILNMQSGSDMEKLGKELIIRQEVATEIKRRISCLVQNEDDVL